eukprot:TRINITY_DN10824_c0_g1_i1.p1 TRINITY_DN10824_c0_g1~~TRINITY_DN10824_c0_g1_i1.p1  ORF type:complete len:230 (+),score=60.96 TRINITY_DN10824_c0_g1_i1:89-691(+)
MAASELKKARLTTREGAMMMRLAAKDADMADMQSYVVDLAVSKTPSVDFTRQHFTDPAVNVEFQLMRSQLVEMEKKLRTAEAQLARSGEQDSRAVESKLTQKIVQLQATVKRLSAAAMQNEEVQGARARAALAEANLGQLREALQQSEQRNAQLEEDIEALWARVRTLEAQQQQQMPEDEAPAQPSDDVDVDATAELEAE